MSLLKSRERKELKRELWGASLGHRRKEQERQTERQRIKKRQDTVAEGKWRF